MSEQKICNLSCPSCNSSHDVSVGKSYKNALGAERVSVECTACGCTWNEWPEDIEESDAPEPKPVCGTCQDTHKMTLGEEERLVACTFCPVPCEKCRADGIGAFCQTTPCTCSCHAAKERQSLRPPSSAVIEADLRNVLGYLRDYLIRLKDSGLAPQAVEALTVVHEAALKVYAEALLKHGFCPSHRGVLPDLECSLCAELFR